MQKIKILAELALKTKLFTKSKKVKNRKKHKKISSNAKMCKIYFINIIII